MKYRKHEWTLLEEVTIIYLYVWIYILKSGVKYNSQVIIKYTLIFWIINLFISIWIIFNIVYDSAILTLLLLPTLLFYGQWKGIGIFIDSPLVTASVVAIISLIMLVISYMYKKTQ